MNEDFALTGLSALANPTRLALVRLLVSAPADGFAQGDIARHLGITPSRLAFHLTLLEQAGLVAARRNGRHVVYAAQASVIGAILGYVLNDCCGAHPEVHACCLQKQAVD